MRGMRKILLGAAFAALLTILVAAPAGAVPPNEILIAKNLQRLGIIPPYANAKMASAAVAALRINAAEPEREKPVGAAAAARSLSRFLASRDAGRQAGGGARQTAALYTTNALVLLVEFGDDPWPAGSPAPTGPNLPGPLHGSIPAPAITDNATFWPGDFTPQHYQQMLFGDSYPIYDAAHTLRGTSTDTMRTYYLEQSHGTYTVAGDIKDWIKLDLPEAYYGADSDPWDSKDNLTGPRWRVARDAILEFAAQNPGFNWAQYDQENPYGITGTDFNQPDGYVDHLIIIHAGSDQSAGGGAEGSDALWAHSWAIEPTGTNGPGAFGGMIIPGTEGQGPQGLGIWAAAYTMDPEDGTAGVFCHEFGHDLGLDDQYDYEGVTGDTSSGFWTIMADGSWLGREWGIGSKPGPMNADDKTVLGFVKPAVVKRGSAATVTLQPAASGATDASAVKIALPPARHPIALSGRDGATEWYSTLGDDLDVKLTTMTAIRVRGGADLTFRTWYDTERNYDFCYVKASVDNGRTWTTLAAFSGADTSHWRTRQSLDLAAYEGRSVRLRFQYVTDGSVMGRGWEITDLKVGATAIPVTALKAQGWVRVDGRYTYLTDQYYIAEYRGDGGFDEATKNCYEWDRSATDWVDWYGYNRGLHLIYRDTFWSDNDVALHVGYGARMVLDARPNPDGVVYRGNAVGYWRPRIQVRDAAFGLVPTTNQTIYFRDYNSSTNVGPETALGRPAQPWFNDAWTYWFAETPEAGVKLPKLGVRVQVRAQTPTSMTLWVDNVQ